jgi:hypothetical protein
VARICPATSGDARNAQGGHGHFVSPRGDSFAARRTDCISPTRSMDHRRRMPEQVPLPLVRRSGTWRFPFAQQPLSCRRSPHPPGAGAPKLAGAGCPTDASVGQRLAILPHTAPRKLDAKCWMLNVGRSRLQAIYGHIGGKLTNKLTFIASLVRSGRATIRVRCRAPRTRFGVPPSRMVF